MAKALLKVSVVLFFVLLSCCVQALNMGSMVKNEHETITINNSAIFRLLFWNSENETYTLKVSATDYPKDWIVIIDPEEFLLDRNTGNEYVSLPYMNENIKAKSVNVFVKPNEKSNSGTYNITIVSEALYNAIGSLSTIPKRSFLLTVNLTGHDIEEIIVEEEMPVTEDVIENKTYNVKNDYFILLIIIVIIIIAALVLYKKY